LQRIDFPYCDAQVGIFRLLAVELEGRQWAPSRRQRNKQHRALHGNPKVVVANVGALSNLRLAVKSEPEVALLQELWASKEEIQSAAKELGYVAACAEGNPCLAAVLYRPGQGQQVKLQLQGDFCCGCLHLPRRWVRLLLRLGLRHFQCHGRAKGAAQRGPAGDP
jgi:hypothetical protein